MILIISVIFCSFSASKGWWSATSDVHRHRTWCKSQSRWTRSTGASCRHLWDDERPKLRRFWGDSFFDPQGGCALFLECLESWKGVLNNLPEKSVGCLKFRQPVSDVWASYQTFMWILPPMKFETKWWLQRWEAHRQTVQEYARIRCLQVYFWSTLVDFWLDCTQITCYLWLSDIVNGYLCVTGGISCSVGRFSDFQGAPSHHGGIQFSARRWFQLFDPPKMDGEIWGFLWISYNGWPPTSSKSSSVSIWETHGFWYFHDFEEHPNTRNEKPFWVNWEPIFEPS